jgi:hypothetical protein
VASVKWLTEIERIDRAFVVTTRATSTDTNGSATAGPSASRSRCSRSVP